MVTKKCLYDTKKGSHGGIEQKSIKRRWGGGTMAEIFINNYIKCKWSKFQLKGMKGQNGF